MLDSARHLILQTFCVDLHAIIDTVNADTQLAQSTPYCYHRFGYYINEKYYTLVNKNSFSKYLTFYALIDTHSMATKVFAEVNSSEHTSSPTCPTSFGVNEAGIRHSGTKYIFMARTLQPNTNPDEKQTVAKQKYLMKYASINKRIQT